MNDGDDAPATPEAERAYNRFLRRYAEDSAGGGPRAPEAYLSEFAAAARRIAKFLGVASKREGTDQDSTEAAAGPSRSFGPYRLERLLGKGGQGAVHVAFDPRLGRRVALKTLHAAAGWGEEERARLAREAAVAAQLDHPGLCPVYEAGEIEGTPYVAMRLIEGRPLDRVVAEIGATPGAPFDAARAERALRLVEELARALGHAHTRGFVHRDVKPSNVVVDADDRPVLIDFGLARRAGADAARVTATGDVAGTPAYLAPEQLLLPADRIDGRADVYALGIVLYELLVGRTPFADRPTEARLRATLEETPPSLAKERPGAPRGLGVILEVATAKERERRYATAEAFADDLARVRRGEPPLARPPSMTVRLAALVRRRRAVVLASSLAVIAAGLALRSSCVAASEGTRADGAIATAGTERKLRDLADLVAEIADVPARVGALRGLRNADAEPLAAVLRTFERGRAEREALEARLAELEATVPPGNLVGAAEGVPDGPAAEHRRLAGALAILKDAESDDPATSWRAAAALRHRWITRGRDAALARDGAAWREAAETIADAGVSPRYGGLDLKPQPGLAPLGRNDAGLYEFLDLWTTEDPDAPPPPVARRGGDAFDARADARRGVIYVLLPADADGSAPPLFAAKYETTMRIVVRLMRREPGFADPTEGWPDGERDLPPQASSAEKAYGWAARAAARPPTLREWLRAAALAGLSADGPAPPPPRRRAAGTGAFDRAGFCDLADGLAEWCLDPAAGGLVLCDGAALGAGIGRKAEAPGAIMPLAGLRFVRDVAE